MTMGMMKVFLPEAVIRGLSFHQVAYLRILWRLLLMGLTGTYELLPVTMIGRGSTGGVLTVQLAEISTEM